MEENNHLELKDIQKKFGKKRVLNGINLHIKKGKLIGVIGPSGAGKSTLLKILLGIQSKDKGKIIFKGKKVKNQKNLRKLIGFGTQENAFYDKLTVKENLEFFGNLYGVSGRRLKQQVNEIINMTKLPHNTQGEKLSGGMKRRLDLAIAIIHNPELIILDEPTTGLDPLLRAEIWGLIRNISSTGKTIVVASHMLQELERNCDEVALLAAGQIQIVINPKNISERYPGMNTLEQLYHQVIVHVQ